eukprot:COSAG04_NODE_15200_length_540_cov_0.587302_1_plen_67_part_10
MDGGLGSHLLQSGVPRDSQLWSARSLEPQHHERVIAAHTSFIQAGATLITTGASDPILACWPPAPAS